MTNSPNVSEERARELLAAIERIFTGAGPVRETLDGCAAYLRSEPSRLAAVRQQEREECARVAEQFDGRVLEFDGPGPGRSYPYIAEGHKIAAALRARGVQEGEGK